MRLRRLFAVSLVASLTAAAASAQTARRPIGEKDLFRFVWVADPQISPNGARVAFTRVTVDDKGEGYETAIWSVPLDGAAPPTRLTGGTRDSQPRWSPDGKRLAFVRPATKDGKPQAPQIFVMPLDGGEAWRLTDVPHGASDVTWSPDGRRIAFVSDTNASDLEKQRRERAGRRSVRGEQPAEGDGAQAPRPAPDESEHVHGVT